MHPRVKQILGPLTDEESINELVRRSDIEALGSLLSIYVRNTLAAAEEKAGKEDGE